MELIPINNENGNKTVSARKLYNFLEVKTKFTEWAKRMFEYGFIQDIDFKAVLFFEKHQNGIGGTNKTDYELTLDTAKEIAMIQRSEKGKIARRYFIEVEKKAKQLLKPQTPEMIMARALQVAQQTIDNHEQQVKMLEGRNEILQQKNQVLTPKAEYYDKTLASKSTMTTTQIASDFDMSARALNKQLHELGVQRKVSGQWILYSEYQGKGYTDTFTYTEIINGESRTFVSTVWTQKGRLFINELLNKQSSGNSDETRAFKIKNY